MSTITAGSPTPTALAISSSAAGCLTLPHQVKPKSSSRMENLALMAQLHPNLGLALTALFKNLIWTFYGTLWGYS
jgi:hypothetical protein